MTLYHFSNSKFDSFNSSLLGNATVERASDYDDTMIVSRFGFCFIEEDEIEALENVYGEDFGAHLAECEFDGSENFDSTYDDFCAWVERDGEDSVRSCLAEDGIEYLCLWNGAFNEIIVLDSSKVQILNWIK
ncbi:hypothetical protein [Oscillibacter sp.]|uniref:hypothetical protein n=1 Tax=Oscillibacter sp. TaxID=1945593 RepID=UPI00289D05E9|nr:hypothetical protein [Oscillibacter sp.]